MFWCYNTLFRTAAFYKTGYIMHCGIEVASSIADFALALSHVIQFPSHARHAPISVKSCDQVPLP